MGTLKELLETEEGKAEFDAVFNSRVEEMGYKAPTEIEGLVKKKDELLNKVARLNRDQTSESQRAILQVLAEVGVDSADDIKAALDGRDKSSDLDRQFKRVNQQLEEANKKYESERGRRLSTEKDNAIIRSLKDAKIKESSFDMAYAYFDRLAEVEEIDGKVNILAKDAAGLGPSMDTYIKEWAKSEAAKDYVMKPVNIGAGVAGQKDGDNKTTYTREELSDPKVARKVMERKKAGEQITIE